MSDDGRAFGWPFLYARGRRRGHRILLAPDFLVGRKEHGWLGERVGRVTNPPAGFGEFTTPSGVPLLVLVRHENLTPADLGLAGDPSDRGKTLDEFGRVLHFSYGLVCRPDHVPAVTEAGLRRARDMALEVYRDFLDGEEAFRTRPSTALGLRAPAPGTVTPSPGVAARTPATPASTSEAGIGAGSGTGSGTRSGTRSGTGSGSGTGAGSGTGRGTGRGGPVAGVPGPPHRSRRGLIVVISAIVLTIAAGSLLWSLRRPPEPQVPAACAQVRVTAGRDLPCPTPGVTDSPPPWRISPPAPDRQAPR